MSEHIFEAEIGGPKIGYQSFEFIAHYTYTPAEKGSRGEPDIEAGFEITDIVWLTKNPSTVEITLCGLLCIDIIDNGNDSKLIEDIKQSAGL